MAEFLKDLKAAQATLTKVVTSKKIVLEVDLLKVIMDKTVMDLVEIQSEKLDQAIGSVAGDKAAAAIFNAINAYGSRVEKKAPTSKAWAQKEFKSALSTYLDALGKIGTKAVAEAKKKPKLPAKVDAALKDKAAWTLFGAYCRKTFNDEGWDFVDRCKGGVKKGDLQDLFDTYIEANAPKGLNINRDLIEQARGELGKATPDMAPFREAYTQALVNLQDPYKRFAEA